MQQANKAVHSLINYETVKYFNNEKYETLTTLTSRNTRLPP